MSANSPHESDFQMNLSRSNGATSATNSFNSRSTVPPPPFAQPFSGAVPRRTSMSEPEQSQCRASIRAIMSNPHLTPLEKRKRVQSLMDGRRATVDVAAGRNPYLEMKAQQAALQNGLELQRTPQNVDCEGDACHERPLRFHRRGSSDGNPGIPSDDDYLIEHMQTEPSVIHHLTGTHSDIEDVDDGVIITKKNHPYSATTTTVPMAGASTSEEGRRFLQRSFSTELSKRAIEMAPLCTHYQRKCHIVSPCCGATFGCRICHDDCPILPPLLNQGNDESLDVGNSAMAEGRGERKKYQRALRTSSMPTSFPLAGPPEHHNLDRFAIKEIICRECFTRQGSKTNFCVNCNVQFGEYHCAICNLWMPNEERPYHCPDCGFCRVGGGENFRHCLECGMCIDRLLFHDHNCQVGRYMINCPVCQEDLFSSREASHELPCGHAIHWHCFRELASHDSRCPCCKKTAETHERMKPTWDAMAMGIALQPLPPQLAKVVSIKCNDCEVDDTERSWHFLGVQCRQCESFNTVVESVTMMGQEAHDFLLRMDPPVDVTLLQRNNSDSRAETPPS